METPRVHLQAKQFPEELAGLNGADFVAKEKNCFSKNALVYCVGQAMKAMKRLDPRHCDGGASILHMGITIYGNRQLLCWLGEPKSAALGAEPTTAAVNNIKAHSFPQYPGKVYLGNLCAVSHQVEHNEPHLAEPLSPEGHLITVMLRSDYFRHSRARKLEGKPSPYDLYREADHKLHRGIVYGYLGEL